MELPLEFREYAADALGEEIAGELECEIVALDDGINRAGLFGWLRSGMDAMAR